MNPELPTALKERIGLKRILQWLLLALRQNINCGPQRIVINQEP